MLHDVVPVLAVAEFKCVVDKGLLDRSRSLKRNLIQHLLQNPTPKRIKCQLPCILNRIIDDELKLLMVDHIEALLNHVVPVLIVQNGLDLLFNLP